GGLLLTLQGMSLMRLEGRAMTRMGAAIWDRLLGLPPGFFRRFTAGELTVRMSVFWTLRDQVSGVLTSALLGIIFLLPALGLLFLYNAALAWTSLGAGLFALAVTSLLGFLQIAPQRRRYAAARWLAGELFQFISGMSKLRSAGAERSAFAAWARGYRAQILARRQSDDLNKHLVAFSAAVPALAGAGLFAVAFWQGPGSLTTGDFLVVYAASMVFYMAVIALGRSFELVAAVIVAYEQLRPMLLTPKDNGPALAPPAELSGDVHFDRVSFRYSEDGPLILDDVSIAARPGEFVAIVGESGSGKTTLLRLALGLEEPTGGAVYYDGRDLTNLDRSSVRRQIGTVVQDGALLPGNILDNIVGMDDDLTIDDAWRAARLADADGDIAAMPMEMFTPVNDSMATFSGGQMQRIMVAAALVRNPQILFLDEATSWLDTNSQARVMQGIESLAATRIVIAHRMSTIRKADRIYVLHDGRVVQQGGFDELYETEGMFRELAQRQMA
ncbi:MAG: ATP-binding cassette domain-containing protein, partial [Anaerolineaceae bacterium]|nr:ATP-binding cassette domain-containing protein [Anaerolineaceae bacterium]